MQFRQLRLHGKTTMCRSQAGLPQRVPSMSSVLVRERITGVYYTESPLSALLEPYQLAMSS